MGDMSPNRFATRFAFSPDDLVIIEGRPMRLCYRNSEGCSFQPENGGLVEHFSHPEIAALQRANSGRSFESAVARGDNDALGQAVLNVDDLTRVLVRWVVDVYHNTPHEGLGGRTPLEAWEQAMLDWGVTPPPGPELQAQIFARPMTRKLEGDGITILGVRYHSRELATWRLHHHVEKVDIRWSPGDLGAIWVKAGKWVKVPAVFEGFAGLRAEEWALSASTRPKCSRAATSRLPGLRT